MMKKIIMLLAVTFSLAIVNAQEKTTSETKTEMKKSCSKDCTKSCCANKAEAKKSCSSSKKSCSKTCSGGAAYSKTVDAKSFIAFAKKFPAEQIVDIRTREEVKASGKLKDAIVIDYNSREFKVKMNELDKDAAIMIYCNSGKRSTAAIPLLKSWGFKKIYEMEGGYQAYLTAFPKK